MTLLEQWRNSAYEQERDARSEQMFWANYFNYEKGIYEQILKTLMSLLRVRLRNSQRSTA